MKSKILHFFITLALVSSCSSPKTKPKEVEIIAPPSVEAKQLASEQDTSLVTEFSFKKGSEQLSPASKKQLDEIKKKALSKGKIEMIKVITWADQEYPSAIKNKLSADQQKLANNRNERIKNYLKKIHPDTSTNIELISMAQRPTFLKNLLSSEDARIKRTLESAGIPDTESTDVKGSKASKSIVLILIDSEKK